MPSKAEEFRSKAFECHECALGVHNPEAKRMLEDLARLWWYLAERADKIVGTIPINSAHP
jgi:hypothetical protein